MDILKDTEIFKRNGALKAICFKITLSKSKKVNKILPTFKMIFCFVFLLLSNFTMVSLNHKLFKTQI